MPMFSREDVDLYYECHGSGAPLFLIAGLASDSQSCNRSSAVSQRIFASSLWTIAASAGRPRTTSRRASARWPTIASR